VSAWPVDRDPTDYEVGHAEVVLPDRVLSDGRVVVRAGLIVEVGPHPRGAHTNLDARGRHLLPGLVDVHSDTLSRECHPRPGASLPVEFALASAAARLRAAGVTTAFHGLAYQARSAVGVPISSPGAGDLAAALDGAAVSTSGPDHRVLHRLDIRCPEGRADLERRLAAVWARGELPVVSHEDHTPGQGQYADPATMRRWLVTGEGFTEESARAHVDWWRRSRDERAALAHDTLAWLGDLAGAGRLLLFGHDPATPEDIDGLVARGGTVAEFPTSRAAARHARDCDLVIVVGAPNVVRGGSHAGNVAAAELAAAGLADALASDYLPTALLPAALRLVRAEALPLPAAIGLVTSGPAAAVGLHDRGRIAPGRRADLVLADLGAPIPEVRMVLTAS
jgi:alpha-D-ribose 1-methylphosphonate 5-triphosphate diphosphatase